MVDKLNEPKWKNDIVKTIWKYARENGLVDGNGHLPKGLGEIVRDVRRRCDRCGQIPEKAREDSDADIGIWPYQCCWVHTETEDYCPHYCLECHQELQKQRRHEVISV